MRSLDPFETLAIRAALLPHDDALTAWKELVTHIPWMELPDPIQRCLATIAVNLKCHSRPEPRDSNDIPHAAQLAGVYRSTWAANIGRIHALGPVLDAFDAASVDYRVVKGTAMCAMSDHWGMRRMGDIDIVVDTSFGPTCIALLRTMSFHPMYFRVIDDADPPRESSWRSPAGHIIDLHLGNPRKRHVDVLDLLLLDPADNVDSQGRSWPIPRAEGLVVHAAAHALKGSAASDHLQALLDLASVLSRADGSAVFTKAHSLALTQPLAELQRELGRTTGMGVPITPRRRFEAVIVRKRRIRIRLGTMRQILRDRALTTRPSLGSNVRRRLYTAWLRTGQARPLERIVHFTFGGFLRSGHLDFGRDRRFRFDIPSHLHRRPIRITVMCEDPYERMIFVNGIRRGAVESRTAFDLDSAPRSVEISLRLLGDPPTSSVLPTHIDISGIELAHRSG